MQKRRCRGAAYATRCALMGRGGTTMVRRNARLRCGRLVGVGGAGDAGGPGGVGRLRDVAGLGRLGPGAGPKAG